MFPSPAVLRGSSSRLQLKELLQGGHQGRQRRRSQCSPPHQRLPIYGSLPGPAGCPRAPTGPVLWSHQWHHQSPLVWRQQTCCSIASDPLWWLMVCYNRENFPKSPTRRSLIFVRWFNPGFESSSPPVQMDLTRLLHQFCSDDGPVTKAKLALPWDTMGR